MASWEESFASWASPLGKTEEEKCERIIGQVRKAIDQDKKLASKSVSVHLQGSYRNNTNVRNDSDVDVTVLSRMSFDYKLPTGKTKEDYGIKDATYHFPEFKSDVETALKNYFGAGSVSRSNKTLNVHENSSRVDADVTPVFEHRRYQLNGSPLEGVALLPDNGGHWIPNWHEQHYDNGVTKNKDTSMVYKKIVRVLKRLENKMVEDKAIASIPGFFIECLVWNVPNPKLAGATYEQVVKDVLIHVFENTKDASKCEEWGEVSELKYLFKGVTKWTPDLAKDFTHKAWNYLGYGK